jgi:putative lipoic acid-binding regulatory protein
MTGDSDNLDQEAPRIEFPCLYPIKIIGKAEQQFQERVVAVVERHTGKIDADLIKVQNSRKNNYLSVTVTIAATGEEQLQNIFSDLKAIDSVKMVL